MFEVGKDVLKHKFVALRDDTYVRGRLKFICTCVMGAFILFAGRTLQLTIQGTNRVRSAGTVEEWAIQRADIVDRNGDILAKNVASGRIELINKHVKDKDREKIAGLIHEMFPYKYSLSDALKLVKPERGYVLLTDRATERQIKLVKNAHLTGLDVTEHQIRTYPKRRLFSHVVGIVGRNGEGQEGAESYFNDYLKENKDPLRLSVDSRIQSVFYEQLSQAMQIYKSKAAMGMLMNSRTGEMLAMVSLPDFDPELRSDPIANHTFKPMRNVYELGSIFKIFNTALALENGISLKKEYPVSKPFPIYNKHNKIERTISDISSFKPPRPNLNVEEIMLHSCNVGSAQIALELPDGAQKEFFERLHMDKALSLDFGRTENTLPQKKWGPVERATVAYGQGYAVTPMHLMLGVNAVTNGGIYIYPTLQKRNIGAVHGERVLSDEVSAQIRPIMLRVAEETSGKKARIAGINIGGKTSTAEKYTNNKVDKHRNITSYVTVFPIEAPQYIMLVVLDEPQRVAESGWWRTASQNAVPTTAKILNAILPLLFE